MWLSILNWVNSNKLLLAAVIISLCFGNVSGCVVGKAVGFRSGYARGFAEGKIPGAKKKIFPNLFSLPFEESK